MDRIIKDDAFLKKVFKRQIKQGIAYHSCVMDYLTISQKVKYTIRRLSEIPILSARIIIQYWEDDKTMMRMLSRHKINDYCVVRGYKNEQTPGYLNIDIDKKVFNPKFVKELLNRHYGNDFS